MNTTNESPHGTIQKDRNNCGSIIYHRNGSGRAG